MRHSAPLLITWILLNRLSEAVGLLLHCLIYLDILVHLTGIMSSSYICIALKLNFAKGLFNKYLVQR